jgi:cell division protein FtsX
MEAAHVLEAFVGALIAIVVGLAFLPTVLNSTNTVISNATYKGNSNFASVLSLATLLPLIFVIVILVGAVGFIIWRRAA